ncbi:tripartite tricarboxylate transporter substrate binding protein [Roseococcus sp. YIM B11640]|uniref:tripartite tricarboxylate transporter substrate binding protein n=1 Tax=Roseococcus sp. YIM B11640 TaxID=3133973 RepID=UPI003C7E63F6
MWPTASIAETPPRAVTLVVPFSAGGAADLAARNFAQHAPRHMATASSAIVVDNRTGASGAVGTQFVARAQPDGHTLLLARVGSSAILPATDARTPYSVDDFTWIGLLEENPYVVCVRADAPWRDLDALLAAIRDKPGEMNFATSGPATVLDLGIRHMLSSAGLPIDAAQAVPFRGGGDALLALLGSQVQFVGNNLGDMIGAIRQRQVRALFVATGARLPELPGVPTATEARLPEMSAISGWSALAAPARLSEESRAFWGRVLLAVGDDPGWLRTTRALGSVPRVTGGEEARDYVVAQIALYRELARRLNLG